MVGRDSTLAGTLNFNIIIICRQLFRLAHSPIFYPFKIFSCTSTNAQLHICIRNTRQTHTKSLHVSGCTIMAILDRLSKCYFLKRIL